MTAMSKESQATSISTTSMKRAVRTMINTLLRQVSQDEIERVSKLVVESVLKSPEYAKSRAIALYCSMPKGEVRTTKLIQKAIEDNKEVYVPRVIGPGPKGMVFDRFPPSLTEKFDELPRNKWGIPELPAADGREGDEPVAIDLVLCPLVAFDPWLWRLGHGGGYYDYFVSRLRNKRSDKLLSPPFVMGLALPQQYVREPLPRGEYDMPLDAVVTDTGIRYRSNLSMMKL